MCSAVFLVYKYFDYIEKVPLQYCDFIFNVEN